jgi:hypothetical protein
MEHPASRFHWKATTTQPAQRRRSANHDTAVIPPGQDTPLPVGTDLNFFDCLNQTIAVSIPIMDGAGRLGMTGEVWNVVGLIWIFLWLFRLA